MLTFSSPAGVTPSTNLEWGGGGIGVSNTQIGFYNGFNVIVDSMLPVIGSAGENNQYVSYVRQRCDPHRLSVPDQHRN